MSWREMTLGEITDLKRGFDLPKSQRLQGDVPVYSSSGITGSNSTAAVEGPCVITGRYGTIGEVFFSGGPCWPLNTALYSTEFNGNNPRFVYYLLQTIPWQGYTTASAVPGVNRNHVNLCPVKIPDKATQDAIVEVLDSIVDKIALNNQLNDYLLELATVRFEQELAKESKTYRFSELIELEDSKRVPLNSRDRKVRKGSYPYYGATSIMDYVDDYLFDGIRVLLGEDGTVIREDGKPVLQYVWGKYWVNNHAHILKSKVDYSLEAIYIALARTTINHIVTGAVQMKISQKNLNDLELEMPTASSLDYLEDIFALYRSNAEESKKLEILRDVLLPKLLSGKIDVSKVDLTQLTNNHLLVRGHNVPNRYWKEHLWKPSLIMFCHRCRTCSIRRSSNIWPKYSESRYCQLRKHQRRRIC